MGITVAQLLAQIAAGLSQTSESSSLDAQVLLSHYLAQSRSWVLAHPEANIDEPQSRRILDALYRMQHGEPLPYVISHWEFYGSDFYLTPDVLIPRPETELLVEHALEWLRAHPQARKVIDVGTGSGCIGISLALHNNNIQVLLTDTSHLAIKVAKENALRLGLSGRLEFVQADLLLGVPGSFDLVCANLPYIPRDELSKLPVVQREPSLALDGGPDGLELITRLLAQARGRLSSGGAIFLEIESSQGSLVVNIAKDFFPAASIQIFRDYAGHDRCVEITPSMLIVHLCTQKEWIDAQISGSFSDLSLKEEGFIHCSRPDQLLQVANHYYRQVTTLKVLWIDPQKVTSEICWEKIDGSYFPHIYGPIELAAVISVTSLQLDHDGYFHKAEEPG